ncbi:MAG TPA: N-methyl-L-tryptophan oxidase [Rubrobacteraceae bacterium]|nr:N-methyl-L-tryptophan oxidase [Rubrobacteraceae bacterium]
MEHGSRSRRYDVIVVGAGAMGSAAAYYLARRGKRVLCIERFGIPHSMGSSHGHTRIIRLAYYEHPSYVMLLRRAYELWREIQETAREQLLHITGSIDAGPEDSWVFKGSWESCKLHDLPHEVVTGAELRRRHPGYHLPPEHLALIQPEGGFLTPERCIVSYVMAAQALGAEFHAHERVLEWAPLESGVRVRTGQDTYEADRLVVTAGAWNGGLVDVLDGLAVPERQVLAWLQPTRPEYFRLDAFPVFNLLVDEGRFYGFPVFGVPGFKFGKYHHLEEVVDPETVDREVHDHDERLLRQFAERYFPDGCGPTMDLQTCMFTNTEDNHFVIDLHPDYEQVSFASPCSGHGFKFASVVGEIMADLAEKGMTRHDISLFRLDRLGKPPSRESRRPGRDGQQVDEQNGRAGSFPRVSDVKPFW